MEEYSIIVIEESKIEPFQEKCEEWFRKGYKLSSSSIGFANSEAYDFLSSYQAILVKPEKTI